MKKLLLLFLLIPSLLWAAEPFASKIRVDVANFDNILNATDTTVQKALDKLENSTAASGNPFDQVLNTTSAVTFTTVNTGQGANELYDMNQNVMTNSSVVFADVNTTDAAYASGWNGNLTVPTKNAIYDKIELIPTFSNEHNQAINTTSSPTFADVNVTSGAYGAGWNGNNTVPNKDDVYDKINAMVEFPGNSSIQPEWANVQNKTAVLTTSSSWSGGDLGGTGLAPSVTDDSHSHTSLTVKQYNMTKGFSYYNITNASDFLLPPLPIAINLNKVTAYCQGGTNVTFMLEECNSTGESCVGVNSTAWVAVNQTELEIINFGDGAIDAGDHMKCNVTQEGNPTFFTLGWDYTQQ
jgi:hypothetical protein